MPVIEIPDLNKPPTYYVLCLICNKKIEQYECPNPYIPIVCDDCKEAVAFAKWLKTGRGKDE